MIKELIVQTHHKGIPHCRIINKAFRFVEIDHEDLRIDLNAEDCLIADLHNEDSIP